MTEHSVPEYCKGEVCGVCYRQGARVDATHKVGEELPMSEVRHNLTQYVCCRHFAEIFGAQSAATWAGCSIEL